MATHTRGSSKRPASKTPPITLKDDLDDDEPVAAPTPSEDIEAAASVAAEPLEAAALTTELTMTPQEDVVVEPAPILEPAAIVAATLEAAPVPPLADAIDSGAWSLTIDVINENAAAMLDLALALGQAKSVGDAIEAQSRFANERYSTFVKRANEFVELTSRFSPFRLHISAFVA